MRLLRTCHALAMLAWVVGVVGLACHVLVLLAMPAPYTSHVTDAAWATAHSDGIEMAQFLLRTHAHDWVTWYYSPLNIRYWALALLYLTPALALTLLTRHLAWCRQH